MQSDAPPVLDDKNCLRQPWLAVPAHAKLLRESFERGGKESPKHPKHSGDVSSEVLSIKYYTFGVYRTPAEFLRVSASISHPFDACRSIPDDMLVALHALLTQGKLQIMKHRLHLLKTWRQWADELETQEKHARSLMHPGVAAVLGSKRTFLLERIGKSLGWPDRKLYDDLRTGFRLTGYLEPTGVFTPDVKPASSTTDDFWEQTLLVKDVAWDQIFCSKPSDYDEPLWNITLEEADPEGKQWLAGPYTKAALEELSEGRWAPTRRFAVWQNNWRPIDDLSASGVNSCFGCFEKVTLKALDEVIWNCMLLFRMAQGEGSMCFVLSDGSKLQGRLHRSWDAPEKLRPALKTFDLKAAYKQLPLHPDEQRKAVLALKSPADGQVYGFVCRTLPFGASASVMHFNRVSLLLQRILQELKIVASCYYDDYPVVAPGELSVNTDSTVHSVMSLLGFSLADDKEAKFSPAATLLGVTVDASCKNFGSVRIGNRPEKARAMADQVQKFLDDGCVEPAILPSAFGRIQFLEAQVLGRTGKLALADLREMEKCKSKSVLLTEPQRNAFAVLHAGLMLGKPRTLTVSKPTHPVLVFTDGACEPEGDSLRASIGGVLYLPGAVSMRAFGAVLGRELVDAWTVTKKHVIGQTELYAVVAARILWKRFLDDARAVFFVDHTGVLSACINGVSTDTSWRQLLLHLEMADEAAPCLSWIARVPSASNPSDAPSRGHWGELKALGSFEYDAVTCFVTGRALRST